MKILAVDTSTKLLCIAVLKGPRIYTYRINSERRHFSLLLPLIKRILTSLKIELEDMNYFAVGLGPGSFTGLRIGIVGIKGIAVAVNKKVIGVPSLDVIAYNTLQIRDGYKFICPILDAKRGLVYTCFYRREGETLKRLITYKLLSIPELVRLVNPRTIFLGDALRLYKETLMLRVKQAKFLDADYYYPQAHNLIKVARELSDKGKIVKADKIHPIYLYPKECQIRK